MNLVLMLWAGKITFPRMEYDSPQSSKFILTYFTLLYFTGYVIIRFILYNGIFWVI